MDKSKLMLIIIIALLILLVGAVLAVGVWFIRTTPVEADWGDHQAPGVTHELSPQDIVWVTLDSITTNLAQGPGGRMDYIVAEVLVGINGTVPQDELESFEATFYRSLALARSEAISTFVSLTLEEVITPEGQNMTAEIIKNRLQVAFESPLIVSVSFSDWTIQRGR